MWKTQILTNLKETNCCEVTPIEKLIYFPTDPRGARWLSGGVSDSGARGPGFETYRRRVVSLSKTLLPESTG